MTNTAKVSHPNGGSNKFAAESKIKVNLDVFGGIQNEVKFKNNGEVSYEFESDALKVRITPKDLYTRFIKWIKS